MRVAYIVTSVADVKLLYTHTHTHTHCVSMRVWGSCDTQAQDLSVHTPPCGSQRRAHPCSQMRSCDCCRGNCILLYIYVYLYHGTAMHHICNYTHTMYHTHTHTHTHAYTHTHKHTHTQHTHTHTHTHVHTHTYTHTHTHTRTRTQLGMNRPL